MKKYLKLVLQFLRYVILDFHKILRRSRHRHYRNAHGKAVKTQYGFLIHYEVSTYHATRLRDAMIRGEYEPDLHVVKKMIKPGDIVVDVGAHEGFFSLLLSQSVGNDGKVFACEPNPENLRFLRENIRINAMANIKIIPCAIGNEKAERLFYFSDGLGAWGSLDNQWKVAERSEKVQVDTLDNILAAESGRIAFMKIDTEGNDFNVLLGSETILTRDKPHICVEVSLSYWAVMEASLNSLLGTLRDKGYELFCLKENGLTPYSWPDRRVFNLYALHGTRIRELQKIRGLFAP